MISPQTYHSGWENLENGMGNRIEIQRHRKRIPGKKKKNLHNSEVQSKLKAKYAF